MRNLSAATNHVEHALDGLRILRILKVPQSVNSSDLMLIISDQAQRGALRRKGEAVRYSDMGRPEETTW